MDFTLRETRFLALLLIAGLVAILTRHFRVPYTVGLVAAGILASFLPFFSDLPSSKEVMFNLLLPPLIFEAAIHIRWKELRKEMPVIALLATLGVCLSAAVTAFGMRCLVGWGWISSLLFGILIAATDPVSVIATFKESGVRGRLSLLVEAESLFNDGTAAVIFAVVLAIVGGSAPTVGSVAATLVLTIGGGVVCGALVGGVILLLTRRSQDHLIEFTFTTIAAFGSFLLAEHFHFSGILAVLTAGLLVGNLGSGGLVSARGKEAVEGYWEYICFLVNSIIFIGIGVHQAQQDFKRILLPAVIAILLVLLGRAASVYPCCAMFFGSRLRVKRTHQFVLFWGGLRGALALALAAGLPTGLPGRETIMSVTFAVVAFSIFVQGLSMTALLRRVGELAFGSRNR
ncbi:MAG TPA: sodium:proton exchanger [Deltaproteobacteria bacterium]|nr:sodium:proton exchanger [Deltaproteobacteria bacterium]